jgi:hypothetical protein
MYKHVIKNSNRYIFNRKQFISDKLDHILSPAMKEYLKLEKDIKKDTYEKFNKDKLDNILSPATKEYLKLEKELKSMNNNIFKRNTR